MEPSNPIAEEAERWLGIAVKLLAVTDFLGSKTFANRARESDPNNVFIDQLLAVVDTMLVAEKRINNQYDWYSILQLAHLVCDPELIASQYQRLLFLLSPERNGLPYADRAFQLVAEAWSVLSDPNKKLFYDSELNFFLQQQLLESQQQQQQPVLPPQGFEPSTQQGDNPFCGGFSQSNACQFIMPLGQPHTQSFQQLPHMVPPHQQQQQPQPQEQLYQQQPQAQLHQQQPQAQLHQHQQQIQLTQWQQLREQVQESHQQQLLQQQLMQWQQCQQPALLPQLQQQQQCPQQHQQQPHLAERYSKPLLSKQHQQQPQRQRLQQQQQPQGQPVQQQQRQPPLPTEERRNAKQRVQQSEISGVNNNRSVSHNKEVADTPRFWTACPYCFYVYEYSEIFLNCSLRCQTCRRAFHGAQIPKPPPIANGRGDGGSYFCWGFFPLGFSTKDWKKRNDLGNHDGSKWVPFSPMVSCPMNGSSNVVPMQGGYPYKARGWVCKDDDDMFNELSESNNNSNLYGDKGGGPYKKEKKKKVANSHVSTSGRKRGRPPKKPGQKRVGPPNTSGRKRGRPPVNPRPVDIENHNSLTSTAVVNAINFQDGSELLDDVPIVDGRNQLGQSSCNIRNSTRKGGRNKLDVHVESFNGVKGNPSATNAGNGVEEVNEGAEFFEGLDEFLSTLPIMNVGRDDKVSSSSH